MKLTIYCNNCGKKIETWTETRKFCSNKCATEYKLKRLYEEPTHPVAKLAHQYRDYDISKILEEVLVKFYQFGLYDLTKLLERNNLKEFCERYREFVKSNKLCKNCGRIYPSTKRSGSKCPHPGCQEYNSQRWRNGVEKNKETKLKKWGDENYNNYEKQVQTMVCKYGVKSPLQMPKCRLKLKETCKEIYGVTSPMKSPQIKAKAEKTCLERYGARNPMQSERGKEKIKETLLKKYGVTHSNHIGRPNFQNFNAAYISQNFIINGELREPEVKKYFNFQSIKPILKLLDTANIEYKRQPKGTRAQRDFFYEFLQSHNANIEYEKAIKPYRVDGFISPENFENTTIVADFKIPQTSRGLIIEYLGDYWHGRTNDSKINEKCNKTAMQLFCETQERFNYLSNSGYTIVYQWESDYVKFGLKLKIFKGILE